MPELPEVQTMADDLKKKIVGRKIVKVWLDWERHIKYPTPKKFKRDIIGAKIVNVSRRAKNVLMDLDKGNLLAIHPRMTGKFLVEHSTKSIRKHVHLILYLNGGLVLTFSDVRKFGKVLFGKKEEILNLPYFRNLGPDPFDKDLSFTKFKEIISIRKKKIKNVLMDQQALAGIGNIYADEILWSAKVHPEKPANSLTNLELKNIFNYMRLILKRAIVLRGTSISDYRDTSNRPGGFAPRLMVYGKEGVPCKRCRTTIKRIKLNGRSAHYCPKCQRLPK